jgi:hypothetical protein
LLKSLEQPYPAEGLLELGVAPPEPLDDLSKSSARDALHGEEELSAGAHAELIDRDDVRVLELARDLGLLYEAKLEPGV